MRDEIYMRLALALAYQAGLNGEIPIGAVAVHEDEVISWAANEKEQRADATAHAEMIVIQQACRQLKRWRLTGATLYVTIEPCPMCAGALVNSRIDRLVYGSADYKAGAVESIFNIVQNDALNHRLAVTAGVRAEACSELMREFFRLRRQK